MRVLLTRPAPEAARTKARLEELGHQVWVAPVMRIVACEAAWPGGAVDAVAASSAQAFQDGLARPPLEMRRLMPLLLVGERTKDAARRCGWSGPATVAPTAADLATLVARAGDRALHIVFMAGRDRKPDLEDGLRANGHRVSIVETYEAVAAKTLEPMAAQAIRAGAIDVVLHYSRRSATIFLHLAECAEARVSTCRHVCLSADAAAPLRAEGCSDILVAAVPNETALLDSLETVQA